MQDAGWEIASHGLKWIDYRDHAPEAERADILEAIRLHTEVTGSRPTGWYTGRSSVNTVDLVTEEGGFDWNSDTYDDDLPYWREHGQQQQLIIPYTLDANDMRFATPPGLQLRRPVPRLPQGQLRHPLRRGRAGSPKMMSVGLHCRLIGRPGRAVALARFIDHIHATTASGPRAASTSPATGPPPPGPRAIPPPVRHGQGRLRRPLRQRFRALALDRRARPRPGARPGPRHPRRPAQRARPHLPLRLRAERLGVLTAHPDLAGKLAAAKRLTPSPPPSRPPPASTPSPTPSAPASKS